MTAEKPLAAILLAAGGDAKAGSRFHPGVLARRRALSEPFHPRQSAHPGVVPDAHGSVDRGERRQYVGRRQDDRGSQIGSPSVACGCAGATGGGDPSPRLQGRSCSPPLSCRTTGGSSSTSFVRGDAERIAGMWQWRPRGRRRGTRAASRPWRGPCCAGRSPRDYAPIDDGAQGPLRVSLLPSYMAAGYRQHPFGRPARIRPAHGAVASGRRPASAFRWGFFRDPQELRHTWR